MSERHTDQARARNGERRDRPPEKLAQVLKQLATEINAEFSLTLSGPLLKEDGSIDMEGFQTKKGGPYRKTRDPRNPSRPGAESIAEDKEYIKEREIEWSDAKNTKVQQYYLTEYGDGSVDGVVAQFRRNRLESHGVQLEMAITVLLHKILKSEFLVLRTAPLDDYKNGVDTLIVDRKTGNVVCSFDEVNDREGGGRYEEKIAAIKLNARQGGSRIKYGVTFKESKGAPTLQRTDLHFIPSFYLALSLSELQELLAGMNYDISQPPTPVELKIFDRLLSTLESQRCLLRDEPTRPEFKLQLEEFYESLRRMRALAHYYKK